MEYLRASFAREVASRHDSTCFDPQAKLITTTARLHMRLPSHRLQRIQPLLITPDATDEGRRLHTSPQRAIAVESADGSIITSGLVEPRLQRPTPAIVTAGRP